MRSGAPRDVTALARSVPRVADPLAFRSAVSATEGIADCSIETLDNA
jgi:hypothetical protein